MMLHESFKMDVLGQPRRQPVPLPSVIKGGRPGAIPNTRVGYSFQCKERYCITVLYLVDIGSSDLKTCLITSELHHPFT